MLTNDKNEEIKVRNDPDWWTSHFCPLKDVPAEEIYKKWIEFNKKLNPTARHFKCSVIAIKKWLLKNNLIELSKIEKKYKNKILKLIEKKYTTSQICSILNLRKYTVDLIECTYFHRKQKYDILKEKIKNLRNKNFNYNQIAHLLRLNYGQVKGYCRQLKVQLWKRSQRKSINNLKLYNKKLKQERIKLGLPRWLSKKEVLIISTLAAGGFLTSHQIQEKLNEIIGFARYKHRNVSMVNLKNHGIINYCKNTNRIIKNYKSSTYIYFLTLKGWKLYNKLIEKLDEIVYNQIGTQKKH